MVKDYARKTYTRKRKTKKSSHHVGKSSHHVGLYLLVVLLLCLFFTGLYYKKTQPAAVKKTVVSKVPAKPQGPVFEFYTLLPKVKNTLNETDTSIVSQKQITGNYFLQVAALHRQEDADALKAKLLLLGFDVTIKTQNIKGETWYRVNIGPYPTLSALHNDQNRLRENNINSIRSD